MPGRDVHEGPSASLFRVGKRPSMHQKTFSTFEAFVIYRRKEKQPFIILLKHLNKMSPNSVKSMKAHKCTI